ncbi:uncharacterized protein PHALS_07395 [Plasmopara halstedii]|uniref:RxLR-like protein n=1 Tax=Plasmopara halstedii TaxID=4781 RepID=A0A0P1B7F4_PLAHL|nr:uncharacterized protein PHALS_07395 [Plasmopara halstedii]CEG49642.1 hypothetical protein PHALS_07395 [Plasmopara halstedii]|eukprot:XP_024586011.1 hypothetical protein PHALS_07395 [Plasmopara halstedii]
MRLAFFILFATIALSEGVKKQLKNEESPKTPSRLKVKDGGTSPVGKIGRRDSAKGIIDASTSLRGGKYPVDSINSILGRLTVQEDKNSAWSVFLESIKSNVDMPKNLKF